MADLRELTMPAPRRPKAKRNLRLALVQMDCSDSQGANVQAALDWLDAAKRRKADVVVLPELFNTGYYLAAMRQKARSDAARRELECAAHALGLHVLAGMPEFAGGRLYNSAWWCTPDGKSRAVYRKNHRFAAGSLTEANVFAAGRDARPFATPWGPFGVQICFDLRYPDAARTLAKSGARLLVYPSAFGAARIHHWRPLLQARAIENQCFVAGCNRVGVDDMAFGGQSAIFDPQGRLVAGFSGQKEGLLVAALDLAQADAARTALKLW